MTGTWKARAIGAALLFGAHALVSAGAANASFLGKLLGEAAETGGKLGARGARESASVLHGVEAAARHVASLPPLPNGRAMLAAHVGHEGHWTFSTRTGERFTAGTPEELRRALTTLAPDTPSAGLTLVVSEDTVFRHVQHIKDLPPSVSLALHHAKATYPLRRLPSGALAAEVRPLISIALTERAPFAEAVAILARPLDAGRLRVLSLEPGGPQTLKPRPPRAAADVRLQPQAIDPFKLTDAMATVKGETVLLSARVDGEYLRFLPPSGAEQTLLVRDVEAAAARHDIDLVILQSVRPEQPGSRSWLYREVAVAGLDKPRTAATLADLMESVAERRGRMLASIAQGSPDRTTLRLSSAEPPAAVSTGGLTEWFDEIVQNIAGNVVTSAIEVEAKSMERSAELDRRLIANVPSAWQWLYLGAIAAGVMGIGVARRWWLRVWPPEARAEYGSRVGFWSARLVRLLAFLLLFLPLAGGPALLVTLAVQAWSAVTLPVRALRWLIGRHAASGG